MSVTKQLKKILIANRGEIACRIIRTAKRLGIKTVCVYSDADANSMHVTLGDEAYNIGKPPAQQSYLRGDKLVEVCKATGATAVHPGYGFLSESVEFATLCQQSGVTFIGPPPSAIRDMGIKSTSKEIMGAAGVPVVPGYHGDDQSESRLLSEAEKIGYPLMIKAVRGGGGKGMRIVKEEEEFLTSLASAKRESLRSFGDDAVLLERYVGRPRHVEVQVFGDTKGNYVHLFERDCSVQRRHQKVIEQAPAPGLDDATRLALGQAGVKAARAVGYVGAGTVEFILDTDTNQFYFMEMNTRLQVEHPVTEMVTGQDLVEWQLRVAAGEPLPLTQEEIQLSGHSLEARIYAENVPAGFMPTAGKLIALHVPSGPHIRVETGVRGGDEVSVHYDPMIAKLVVWHEDSAGAFARLEQSLAYFNIVGVENNVDFLRKLCIHEDLVGGNVHTGFIEEHKHVLMPVKPADDLIYQAAAAVVLKDGHNLLKSCLETGDPLSPFATEASFRMNMTLSRIVTLKHHNHEVKVEVNHEEDGWLSLRFGATQVKCRARLESDKDFAVLSCETDSKVTKSRVAFTQDKILLFTKEGDTSFEVVSEYSLGQGMAMSQSQALSPMPGVVEKVHVKAGDQVKPGDPIAVIMAMKMEHIIKADKEGVVAEVLYKAGDSIGKNVSLVTFQE